MYIDSAKPMNPGRMLFIFLQIWYYTNGILREAGFAENMLPYFTLSTGAIETLAAIISVSMSASLVKSTW